MLIKKFNNCPEIIAGDNSVLRELLNNHTDKVESRYSIAWAQVPVGAKTWLHVMKTTEVYFILKGKGIMYLEGEKQVVEQYDTIYISPHAKQQIENTGEVELEFLCLVDPAWTKEDEILLQK